MDEVFYWLVNQMVGLQYNYRTQINKHLRKAFKLVDKKGKGEITVTVIVPPYAIYWILVQDLQKVLRNTRQPMVT